MNTYCKPGTVLVSIYNSNETWNCPQGANNLLGSVMHIEAHKPQNLEKISSLPDCRTQLFLEWKVKNDQKVGS